MFDENEDWNFKYKYKFYSFLLHVLSVSELKGVQNQTWV